VTSLLFDGERLVAIRYAEPAGATSPKVSGA
jgi:hypothetical protein